MPGRAVCAGARTACTRPADGTAAACAPPRNAQPRCGFYAGHGAAEIIHLAAVRLWLLPTLRVRACMHPVVCDVLCEWMTACMHEWMGGWVDGSVGWGCEHACPSAPARKRLPLGASRCAPPQATGTRVRRRAQCEHGATRREDAPGMRSTPSSPLPPKPLSQRRSATIGRNSLMPPFFSGMQQKSRCSMRMNGPARTTEPPNREKKLQKTSAA